MAHCQYIHISVKMSDNKDGIMESAAMVVVGGVAAVGSGLSISKTKSKSKTKVQPVSSTFDTGDEHYGLLSTPEEREQEKKRKKRARQIKARNKNKKEKKRRVVSRLRSMKTKWERKAEKKYPSTIYVYILFRIALDLSRWSTGRKMHAYEFS